MTCRTGYIAAFGVDSLGLCPRPRRIFEEMNKGVLR